MFSCSSCNLVRQSDSQYMLDHHVVNGVCM